MILLYGAGGEPGRGEIPMDPIRYRASDDFLFCILGSRKNEMQRRKPPKGILRLSWIRNDSNKEKGGKPHGKL